METQKAEAFNANGAFRSRPSASKAVHSIEIVLQNVGDMAPQIITIGSWMVFGVSPDAELELSCVPSACSKSQMVRAPEGNDVVVNVVKSLEYENILRACKYRQHFRMTCRLSVVRDMVDSHALGAERQIFVLTAWASEGAERLTVPLYGWRYNGLDQRKERGLWHL